MDLERKADNHPDAEPPRGSERRASLKPERGSVEKVPRNRKRQSRSALSLLRGTDGSNPASSSGESIANLFEPEDVGRRSTKPSPKGDRGSATASPRC